MSPVKHRKWREQQIQNFIYIWNTERHMIWTILIIGDALQDQLSQYMDYILDPTQWSYIATLATIMELWILLHQHAADSLILLFGRVPCMLEHQRAQCLDYVLPWFSIHYSCVKSLLDSSRESMPVRYDKCPEPISMHAYDLRCCTISGLQAKYTQSRVIRQVLWT